MTDPTPQTPTTPEQMRAQAEALLEGITPGDWIFFDDDGPFSGQIHAAGERSVTHLFSDVEGEDANGILAAHAPTLAQQVIELADALAARDAELALERERWIPVEERLPEEGAFVLVATHEVNSLGYFRYAQTAYLLGGEWHQVNGSVSHWRPLPAPPAPASAEGVSHE